MTWLMDEADVCRTSSRASRRPLDVISTVAILDPRWRGRKWRHPGPGAVFSSPIVAVAQDGGPSASGRHLGWPHLREPEMRSSKMATGSGRAAILRHRHNGARKNRPILLMIYCLVRKGYFDCDQLPPHVNCLVNTYKKTVVRTPYGGNVSNKFQKHQVLFIEDENSKGT